MKISKATSRPIVNQLNKPVRVSDNHLIKEIYCSTIKNERNHGCFSGANEIVYSVQNQFIIGTRVLVGVILAIFQIDPSKNDYYGEIRSVIRVLSLKIIYVRIVNYELSSETVFSSDL